MNFYIGKRETNDALVRQLVEEAKSKSVHPTLINGWELMDDLIDYLWDLPEEEKWKIKFIRGGKHPTTYTLK